MNRLRVVRVDESDLRRLFNEEGYWQQVRAGILTARLREYGHPSPEAVSDMSLAQVNHHERNGVLPVAFSFSHFMRGQDQSVSRVFLGESPLWESGGRATKVGVTVNAFGREESVEEM
jgi:hypothetical protein